MQFQLQRTPVRLAALSLVLLCSLLMTCGKKVTDPSLPPPSTTVNASFGASVTSGPPPLTVSFADSSSGQPDFWFWRFGDGQTSFSQNPSHTYSQEGTYTVTLIVSRGEIEDSLIMPGYIVVDDTIGATVPVANFTADPSSGPAPLGVQFTNASTGTISSYNWNFGDGGTSTQSSPNHLYTDTGTFTVRLIVVGPAGRDTSEQVDLIRVTEPAPTAAFSANPRSGQPPLQVQFTSQSTGEITAYQWSFGDGATSADRNPTHSYSSEGTYTVRLIVSGPGGSDTAEIANYVAVSAGAPMVSFTGTPTSGVAPLSVQFTNNTAGQVVLYSWSFGDETGSAQTNPSHTYQNPGTYTVRLIGTGPGGTDTLIRTNYIIVTPAAPTAGFTGSPTSGASPLTVQFDNTSSGQITSYAWSFGDGGVSNLAEPSHTYNAPGRYTVRLIVSGPGGSDTLTRIDYINVTAAAPTAGFTGAPTSGTVPLQVQFTNTSSGVITSYSWRFGDGTSSTEANPNHTYTSAGTYDVRLIVSGPGGADTLLRVDYITATPGTPTANFFGEPTSGPAPLTVDFSNISTGQVTSRLWSFGDGATSTDPNPDHTYQNPGTYTVRLIINGPGGSDTLTRVNYITVLPPRPVANFTGSPTSGDTPLHVDFNNTSTGQITSYLWDFGDGGTSTQAEPSHNYNQAGVYDVTLIVTGPGGSDTLTRSNYITATTERPVAGYSAIPTSGPVPLSVQFLNTSSGEITSYQWSFGDGETSTAVSPSHTYDSPGQYTVRLIVSGPGGADTLTQSNYITATSSRPTANFTGAPTSGLVPLAVQFDNTSTGSISSYLWDFGDGATSTASDPSHTYENPGQYDVTLVVSGPGGADTLIRANYITATAPNLLASFTAEPTSGTAPLFVQFTNQSSGNPFAFLWSFGDGEFSLQENPAHVYESPGAYSVRLVVTGLSGADTLTIEDYITVTAPPPVADFSANPTTGAAPMSVQFTDLSGGTVTSWEWDFGDGGTSAAENPEHTYQAAGTYTVRLIVTGPGGSDTLTRTNYITTSSLGSTCTNNTLQLAAIGPFWPERTNGDCKLDEGDVRTNVGTTLYTSNGGTQLWATVRMDVEEAKGDHSAGSLSKNVYLGYTAPDGFIINKIVTAASAEWSYADKDEKLDQRDTPLGTFEVMAQTKGDDICGTTADDSNFTFTFNAITLEVCKTTDNGDDGGDGAPGI